MNPSAFQVAISTNSENVMDTVLKWDRLIVDWAFVQNGKNFMHRLAMKKGIKILYKIIPYLQKENTDILNELFTLRMDDRD